MSSSDCQYSSAARPSDPKPRGSLAARFAPGDMPHVEYFGQRLRAFKDFRAFQRRLRTVWKWWEETGKKTSSSALQVLQGTAGDAGPADHH